MSTSSPTADKDAISAKVGTRGALYQAERTLRSMRAYGGVILFSSTFQPIMYILAMGLGLGALIGATDDFVEYGAESYLMYIAPAILASTVAMSAGIEFTFPVMAGFRWRREYYAAQATAITPGQIALGHIMAASVRFLVHSVIFLAVLFIFGVLSSPLAWLQLFTAVLGALAIGLPIMAYISTLREEKGHAALIQRFVIMPLFLFSGTFYPLSNLPVFMHPIGWLSPIWHTNELGRVLAFGQPTSGLMIGVHLTYLVGIVVVSYVFIRRTYIRRLGYEEWGGRTPGAKRAARKQQALETKEAAQAAWQGDAPQPTVRSGLFSNMYSGNIRAVFQRGIMAIRNSTGLIFVSGFLEPVLFLASFGLGISPMLEGGIEAADGTISYAAFIAPALLAVAAMNGAVFDSTWNVFFKLRMTKLYRTMMATSLGPLDVAVGEILLALFRGALYALGFLVILTGAGLVSPAAALLMWITALFIALGFACVGMAATSFMKRFQQMDWMMMVLIPMFLFSATLFPISVYPAGVQAVIQALPLWHGVELMRDIAFWEFSSLTLVHIGYYLVMILVGGTIATYRMKALFLR